MAVDYKCAYVMCYGRFLTTESPTAAEAMTQTRDQRISPEDIAKRAGFTDTAGACMAFHCGGQSPGTLGFLLCASRNRCAG